MNKQIKKREDMLVTRLKWLRKEILEITQPEMGKMLGVTAATISYWESGKPTWGPRVSMLIKIALVFGVSIDYLFGFSEEAILKE